MKMADIQLTTVMIILAITALSGCHPTTPPKTPQEIVLTPDTSLKKTPVFNDMGNIVAMAADGDQLYLMEQETSIIHALSIEDMQHRFTIGGPGQGPGEFSEAEDVFARDGLLFVADYYGHAFNVFKKSGDFEKKIMLNAYPNPRFYVDENHRIFFPSPYASKVVTTVDFDGKLIRRFGDRIDIQNGIPNFRYVFSDGKKIYAVPHYTPVIECFSLEGELLAETSLAHLPLIREIENYKEEFFKKHPEKKKNTTIQYYDDGYFHAGKLYLLAYKNRRSTRLMVFGFEGNRAKLEKTYHLTYPNPQNHVHSTAAICLDEQGRLLAFEPASNRIHRFILK